VIEKSGRQPGAMKKDTRTTIQLLRVNDQTALKIQNKMSENELDFSECDQREFNHAARTAYRQILQLRPELRPHCARRIFKIDCEC
jgi:hypothetical protein